MLALLVLGLVGLLLLLAVRVWLVLPRHGQRVRRRTTKTASLAVFLGSGGHTAEMRTLLSAVDRARYTPRIYVYCDGDEMSLRAVAEAESRQSTEGTTGMAQGGTRGAANDQYTLLALPRARRVGEGKLSTLRSATITAITAAWHIFFVPLLTRPSEPWADVLLLNGPGTAVVLVMVCYIRRILGLSYTRIIYVESFARVKSLSLSGRLLRPLVDTFVVQWPEAAGGGAATYRGWLA